MFNKQSKNSERWAHFFADFFVIIGRLLNVVKLYWNGIATVALISKIVALSKAIVATSMSSEITYLYRGSTVLAQYSIPAPETQFRWLVYLISSTYISLTEAILYTAAIIHWTSGIQPSCPVRHSQWKHWWISSTSINLLYLVTALHYNQPWHRTIHAPLFKSF